MTHRPWVIAVAALVALAVAVGAAVADPGEKERPKPLPPQAAAQAIWATGKPMPDVVWKTQIDPSEVPGLSRFQQSKFKLMGYGCWNTQEMGMAWGTWPYEQVVWEDRYWCGYFEGGVQTYRQSNVRTSSPLCGTDNRYEYRVSGGNGWNYTVVRSGANFSCPGPIDWITAHPSRWQDWHCDTYTWTPCRRIATS